MQTNKATSLIEERLKASMDAIIDAKLKAALFMAKGSTHGGESWFNRSVLESKAVQEISTVVDVKQYRQWNKKMKNALDQIRPYSRQALDQVEKLNEDEINEFFRQGVFDSRKEAIISLIAHKTSKTDLAEILRTLNTDMWAILSAKAEGEAEEKTRELYSRRRSVGVRENPLVVHSHHRPREEHAEGCNHATSKVHS